MVPKLNVQSVCIYFNAFSQILQCLFGRSVTPAFPKTHQQGLIVLRRTSFQYGGLQSKGHSDFCI